MPNNVEAKSCQIRARCVRMRLGREGDQLQLLLRPALRGVRPACERKGAEGQQLPVLPDWKIESS